MKALLNITLIFFLLICVFAVPGQSIHFYMHNSGLATVAALAHPTSTVSSSRYKVAGDYIYVKISFTDGVTARYRLTAYGRWIIDIDVVEDTDWYSPFNAVGAVKDILIATLEEEDQDITDLLASFEDFFGRSVYDFTGEQVSIMLINLDYLAYTASTSFVSH